MLQLLHPLVGLHGMAHGPLEGGTMARHVDLWDDGDTIVGRCADNVAALFLRVVFPGKACHRVCCGELGITLHLEAPRLVLRQVEVERVHLEAPQQPQLPLQLADADVAAPHIVHEAAQLEGRPVDNLAGLHLVFRRSFHQLGEGLNGTDDACLGNGRDADALLAHAEPVGLVGIARQKIVVGSLDAVCPCYLHTGSLPAVGGLLACQAAECPDDTLRRPTGEAETPRQHQGSRTFCHRHLLRHRQEVCYLSFCHACHRQSQHSEKHSDFHTCKYSHNIPFTEQSQAESHSIFVLFTFF